MKIDILLLLALYREITLANASIVQSPKSKEVRKLLISLTMRLQYANVVNGLNPGVTVASLV